ncbi:amino acid ABC transporter permease [Polyangium sorediatum]|uniref:Amino acid ABC transporter permease n=1 Tax=Polyangium sorediatum TaxID=889274 RepID=A0ABT6P4Q7_9BACT|nr:amino acid ABC transporter permease [Polyangium sorediatum]MDI1435317.1 amino acid ABC transporter permease [Polyangium sorediatum]
MNRIPTPHPIRGIAALREGSRPLGVVSAAVGGLALAIVLGGTASVLTEYGIQREDRIAAALQSSELFTILVSGSLLGAGATALGFGTYRRMPTRVSREEAIAGAVLGLQAALCGLAILWFIQGDMERFARNFLSFEQIVPHYEAFLNGARNTLLLAGAGELFGVILGLVLSVFTISKRAVVRAPVRVYINLFRGTPLLLQLSLIYFGLALGLGVNMSAYTAAILAFSLNTGAYSAEVFRAGIQSIERGQMEAARGLGLGYMQSMRYVIVPQAVRRVIPPLMNEFVILIKDTSLIAFLGLSFAQRDLFTVGSQGYSQYFNATFYVASGLGYLVVTLPLIRLVTWVEKRLRSGLLGAVA